MAVIGNLKFGTNIFKINIKLLVNFTFKNSNSDILYNTIHPFFISTVYGTIHYMVALKMKILVKNKVVYDT